MASPGLQQDNFVACARQMIYEHDGASGLNDQQMTTD